MHFILSTNFTPYYTYPSGNLGGTAKQVAPALIDAIGEFVTSEQPKNVRLVKLVIFQQDMIPVFEETLKTKSGSTFKKPDSVLTRGLSKYACVGANTIHYLKLPKFDKDINNIQDICALVVQCYSIFRLKIFDVSIFLVVFLEFFVHKSHRNSQFST